MRLSSSAFGDSGPIPSEYTCDGADRIPPLSFDGVPHDTTSLVLICHDPDSPSGDWVHWVAYDIPGETRGIRAGQAVGTQGKNSWGRNGYGGPCPGQGKHRYIFTLYALGNTLDFHPGADRHTVERLMKGHVLAEARLTGTYIKLANQG